MARREASGGGFLTGMVAGTVFGAGLAMLFAAKPGAELRQDLADGAGNLAEAAKDRYDGAAATASSIMDKGKQAYDQARESAQQAAEDAGRRPTTSKEQ